MPFYSQKTENNSKPHVPVTLKSFESFNKKRINFFILICCSAVLKESFQIN